MTAVTQTGLSLTAWQTYFFSVQAVNGVGLAGSATNSNGQTIVIDPTPPSAPANVRDGTGADISTTASMMQLSANWDPSTDNESGISGYQYAIGTTAGGTQTLNWTWLGNVTTVTKTGLTLSRRANLFLQRASGQRRRIDRQRHQLQRPNGRDRYDAAQCAAQRPRWNGSGHFHHQFHHAIVGQLGRRTDNESGISGYQYAIGTTAGGTQTVNWTSLGNVTTVTKTGLTLTLGQTYYFSVQAVNGAGLTGSATNSERADRRADDLR